MQIEFIYTFNDGREQEILAHTVTKSALLKSIKTEKALKEFALGVFHADMKEDISKSILKISTCVYLQGEKVNHPKWFINANGKLWFEKNRLDD